MRANRSKTNPLKIVILGGDCGLRNDSILHSCSEWYTEPLPMFDYKSKTFMVDGSERHANFWYSHETRVNEMRHLVYAGTDCFILCYERDNEESYDNVWRLYAPEVKRYFPRAGLLLVEMRNGDGMEVGGEWRTCINFRGAEKGQVLRKKIGASTFIQTSDEEGMEQIFMESVKLAVASKICVTPKRNCFIL